MAIRICGINISPTKHLKVSLTAIYGINRSSALKICQACNIYPDSTAGCLDEETIEKLRDSLKNYIVEGDLRRIKSSNLRRLVEINCYRGRRLIAGLPARGQRTRSNGNTARRLKRSGSKGI